MGETPAPNIPTGEDINAGAIEPLQAEQERQAWVAGPVAAAERVASRSRYDETTDAEAADLLQVEFSDQLAMIDADPARKISDVEIDRMFDPFSARVLDPEHGTVLVDSSVPLQAENDAGDLQAVDLDLVRSGDRFEGGNPLIEAQLPLEAADGILLESAGVKIVPVGLPTAGDARELDGEDLFYPRLLPSTDLMISPVSAGVEASHQLRSQLSPERLSFALVLPTGAALRSDGRGGAEVVQASQVLVHVPAPSAVDAQGSPVSASLELIGNTITVVVPHVQLDLAYPILVDPLFEDWSGAWYNGSAQGLDRWQWFANPATGKFSRATIWPGAPFTKWGASGTAGRGLYAYAPADSYAVNQYGEWGYRVPGQTTTIPSAWIGPLNSNYRGCGNSQPYQFAGIWNENTSTWPDIRVWTTELPSNWYPTPLNTNRTPSQGQGDRWLFMGQAAGAAVNLGCLREYYLGGAYVNLDDPDAPTWNGAPTPPSSVADAYPGPAISVSTTDNGLGVKYYNVLGFNQSGQYTFLGQTQHPCTGLSDDPCPTTWSAQLTEWNPSTLPNGPNVLDIRAYDPLINAPHESVVGHVTVNVDHGRPSIQASGGATTGEGLDLHVQVNSGEPPPGTSGRPGIKTIRVYVDGDLFYTDTMPCDGTPGSCPDPLIRDLQLPYEDIIDDEEDDFLIEAEDEVGRVATPFGWSEDPAHDETVALLSRPCVYHDSRDLIVKNGVVYGTSCGDNIPPIANAKVIRGGPGDNIWHGGPGGQTYKGGAGNDLIFGERGNDKLYGGAGDDRIYGGVGDDLTMTGGHGDDLLVGGQGVEDIRGQQGNDYIRGGGTLDILVGGPGFDTVSFADGVTPGFKGSPGPPVDGFPGEGGERGVYVNLSEQRPFAHNGGAINAGGNDLLYLPFNPPNNLAVKQPGSFERVVGSPFSDLIVGSDGAETIVAGPGADVVRSGGAATGTDIVYGGADGDYLNGGGKANLYGGLGSSDGCEDQGSSGTLNDCERTAAAANAVVPRDSSKISVGSLAPDAGSQLPYPELYINGSSANDNVDVRYNAAATRVTFTAINSGTSTHFDSSQSAASGCTIHPKNPQQGYPQAQAVCEANGHLGTILIHGAGGHDVFSSALFPEAASVILLGGSGDDDLTGFQFEQTFADGPNQGGGREYLRAGAGDDALLNSEGADNAEGGAGSDLIVSSSVCDGDWIIGGDGSDNSSWAQMPKDLSYGAFANIGTGTGKSIAGNPNPTCGQGQGLDGLASVEDLEGSSQRDVLIGSGGANHLLGRGGFDTLKGENGVDQLIANDEATDALFDCGEPNPPPLQNRDLPVIIDVTGQDNQTPRPNCENVDPQPLGYAAKIEAFYDEDQPESASEVGLAIDEAVVGSGDEESTSPAPAAFYLLDDSSGAAPPPAQNEAGPDGTYGAVGADSSDPTLEVVGAMSDDQSDAARLDGDDDYVDLGTDWDPAASTSDGYTVELWVMFPEAPAGDQYLFSRSGVDNGMYLYRSADGSLHFKTESAVGSPHAKTDAAVSQDVWHHVVGTLNANTITLYVDGFAYPLGYGQSVFPGPSGASHNFIGANGSNSGWLEGDVDDVAIYDEALSADVVQEHLAISSAEESETILLPPLAPDIDGDGFRDDVDNCVSAPNPDQADEDQDGPGNACDEPLDSEGDGIPDSDENCLAIYNPDQADGDSDGIGDACDPDAVDDDGDGVGDLMDNCPTDANSNQVDADADGIGDVCDPTPDYKSHVNGSSPLAYWRFGEASGTTASPEVGGVSGTYLGGPALGAAGGLVSDPDTAVALDGLDDQVDFGNDPVLDPYTWRTTGYSVELWVKFGRAPLGTEDILTKLDAQHGIYLHRIADGRIEFGVRRTAHLFLVLETINRVVTSAAAPATGSWHHIVGVLTTDGHVKLFVDGVEADLAVPAWTYDLLFPQLAFPTLTSTGPFKVGNYEGAKLQGAVDELAVYSRALSASEVADHYAVGT